MRSCCAALALAAVALLTIVAAAQALRAQQPAGKRSPPAYRRIFVPQNDLPTQVRGLLPMKRDDFDRRMAGAKPSAPEASAGLRISRGQYTARLEGQDLVGGEARLDLATMPQTTGVVSLEPCNLALGAGVWQETPPRRAVLGVGPRNVLTLHVDKPGTLLLPWSRQGLKSADGAVEFDLSLPPASLQQLRLHLPADLQLTATEGLVIRGEMPAASNTTCEWTVELGGISRTRLRIEDRSQAARPENAALIKEQVRYALTPTDLTAEYQFQLDVHGPALNTAQLQIDPRLTITTVSVAGRPAQWSVAGDAQRRTLSVQFPDPLSVGSHTLDVQAVAEVAAGQPWRLPRLVWPDAVWQEGAATLAVPPSVQLAVSRTSGCHLAKGVSSSGPGEILAFHYFAADGFVEISMLPRQPRLSSSLGVTVQFDPAIQVSATLRADLVSQEGDVFEADAVLANDWVVDAIETEPADLLEDRPVIAQDERSRTMRLKFVRPITPEHPVRLVVRARLQPPSTEEFSARSLWRWFRLPSTIEQPAVLALRNNIPNYDLQVTGDGDASRVDPELSSADELDLLDSPPSGLLFRLPAESGDFRVLLRRGEPRYTAAWDLIAECSRSRLRHRVTVRCTPSGPGLSRLTVHSIPPPDREIRWRVADVTDTTVVAQTRRDTGAAAGVPPEAVWELEFSRPLMQPFTLESTWESPRSPRQSVPLFACLEATTQTCHVRVAAEDDARWFIAARGLIALPIPAQPADRFSPARGWFRYESGRQAALQVVGYGPEEVVPLAQVTSAELTTSFATDGSALNALSLTLANAGLTELPLNVPPTASLREVIVAGVTVEPQLTGPRNAGLLIPLPEGVRDVTVRVSYGSPAQQRPLYAGAWRADLPELSIATPPLRWNVILPAGIRALDEVHHRPWQDQWLARFWGPLFPQQPWIRWLHPWRTSEPQVAEETAPPELQDGGVRHADLALQAGWSLVSQDVAWSPAVTTVVFEPGRWSLFSLSLALLMGGVILATPRHWFAFWWLSAIVLAAAVLILPLVAAALVAGAFWGLIAGCIAALLRPQAARSPSPQALRGSTTRGWVPAGASTGVLLAWLAYAGGSLLHAQSPRDEPPAEKKARTTHRVVIPIDDTRKPVGDYVFVDAEFYDWLHEQAAGGQPSEPWQIEDAVYEIHWPQEVDGEVPAADVLARLEITTFTVDAAVTLPFRRADLLLQQGSARLDGSPLSVAWADAGQGLTAVIPSPGRYRLELACSTPLKSAGGHRELALAIPRAPHAVARISAAAGAAPFTSSAALGSLAAQGEAAGSWQVQLGSAAELSLRSAGADSAGDQQAVEAEQLLSWKIRPGSVVVDAVCKFRALTGTLRDVQIRFDPRLRLLPLEGLPPTARHRVESGSENTLHVSLAEPTAAIAIRPRFLLAESSGVGKLVPPRLTTSAGRISRNWLAVSTGPGVELVGTSPSAVKVAVADFAQAFGVIDGIPAVAFDLAGSATMPELELRPAGRTAIATAQTTLACSLALCRLTFQAELTGLSPAHVQQRIVLPPGWMAGDVSVRDGDLPLACRWFQQADGTVVLRLDQPPGSSQQLRVDATLTPSNAPLSLPAVQLADVTVAEHSLRVERSYDCTVEIREVVGWTADGQQDAGQALEGRRRLVAGFDSASGSSGGQQLMMRIAPNRPQVSARLVTRFARPSSPPAAASLVCDLDITGGDLDDLRLEAPPQWSGPWETSPPLAVRSLNIPGQSSRFVTLTPDRPLAGKVRMFVSSPLHTTAGDPLRVPEIRLVDIPQVDRLVQLPKTRPNDLARWQTTFLQAAQLPADLLNSPLADGDYETLAVVGPHFDAVWSPAPAASADPLVPLIEYNMAWLPTGDVQGRAIIHLDPAGLDSCLLLLDDGYRPLSATLDGIPADIVQQQQGRWLVGLPGDRLPQRLTVEFLGSPATIAEPWSDRRRRRISGPTLVGLPAQATIWSVESPRSLAARASRLSAEKDLIRVDQDLARLTSAAQMLARASERELPGLSGDALAIWLGPWQTEVTIASRRVAASLRTLVVDDGERQERFRQVQTELDRRWLALQGGPPTNDDAAMPAEPIPATVSVLRGAFTGPVSHAELSFTDPAAREPSQRWRAALALLLLGIPAWILARWSAMRDWLAASAPFAVAAGGIALACLSPLGVAALALPIAVLATYWRSPWSRRMGGRHSSIVRLERRNTP
ncbi:MAG TPA: hypothetical protein VMP01_10290 [Pirellulaceae bacterium]|nr:hypothetical protein [Pirellulaceae bacterium]